MKKFLTGGLMVAFLFALTACKEDAGGAPRTSQGVTTRQHDSGPSVTMYGPRLGFDGKIKMGCCSMGIGF